MKKLIALRFLFLATILFAFTSISFVHQAYASYPFQENFDSGNLNNWTVKRNTQWSNPSQPCLYHSNPTTWSVVNGKAGIKIDGPGCGTELIPNNFQITWSSGYTYSFDMDFTNSAVANRNVLFKYLDSSNWYDFMFYGSTVYFQKVVGSYYRVENTSYSFQDNLTYHIKIEFTNNVIKLFINDSKIWEIIDTTPYFNGGTVGLQASVGSDPDSEVWFDNLIVNRLPLNVPLLKQTSEPWQGVEYATASAWAPPNPITINRWGCAMTSAAMVLKYHGINKLPDGTDLDPGTLNTWLNNQADGYTRGNINWVAISDLSKLAKTINNITAFDALEFIWGDNDTNKLKNQIDSNNPPDFAIEKLVS